MSAPAPYRDALRAAQDRIGLLEEKLAARAGDEPEEEDEELARLDAERRALLRSATPRVSGERALVAGLVTAVIAGPAILAMVSKLPHPNLARAALMALFCGCVAAAFTFFVGVGGARIGLGSVDQRISAAKRRVREARQLRAIAREAREVPRAPGGARIAVRAAAEEEEDGEEENVMKRASR